MWLITTVILMSINYRGFMMLQLINLTVLTEVFVVQAFFLRQDLRAQGFSAAKRQPSRFFKI